MAKQKYVIFNPEGGLGKIIASTAVIKFIKQKYPEHKIVVITPWAEVFLNNPRVDRVLKSGMHPYFYKDYIEGRDSVVLKGEPYFNTKHLYSSQHLIKSWCELHDLPFEDDFKPELFYTPAETSYYAHNMQSDKPILVMQTNGGPYDLEKPYSWTRDMPHDQAQLLVNELKNTFKIYHIARASAPNLENVERVQDVPNKRLFLALLFRSHRRLLIDSCLQHAAAAFEMPSTVCWIGTSPTAFGYDIHDNFTPDKPKLNRGSHCIDSLFFDYDFNGQEHEYPYDDFNLFDLQKIHSNLIKDI